MALLRATPNDLRALIAAAANQRGMPQEFVEKDYWVTELLRSVARPIDDAYVVFKGGTSLSKVFGLVERFSEDVDVLVVITRSRDSSFGKGSVDKILKQLCERAAPDLGLRSADTERGSSETGVHRSMRYTYAATLTHAVVKPNVLLELGVRGGSEPRRTHSIKSVIAQHAMDSMGAAMSDFDEFADVAVEVLAPERTLIEKLSSLHHLGSTYPESSADIAKAGRHLYDIVRLLDHAQTLAALQAGDDVATELAEDVARNARAAGWAFTPRPDSGFAASPIFDPGHGCREDFQAAYEAIRPLVYGEMPTFEDCIKSVLTKASLI